MQLIYLAFFYLLGSIPVAWLMGKLAGRGDIRRLGSGNAGVMNVALNVSRWAGLIVCLAEIAKGTLTVLLAQRWQLSEVMTSLAVLVAVAGTRWSIWIRGSGGRGNTLGVAALLVLSWQAVAISGAVWIAVPPPDKKLVLGHALLAAVAARGLGPGDPVMAVCSAGSGARRILPDRT